MQTSLAASSLPPRTMAPTWPLMPWQDTNAQVVRTHGQEMETTVKKEKKVEKGEDNEESGKQEKGKDNEQESEKKEKEKEDCTSTSTTRATSVRMVRRFLTWAPAQAAAGLLYPRDFPYHSS